MEEEEMGQTFVWLGGLLSVVYGTLTAFAGYGQIKTGKIQTWAAWSLSACGLLVVVAGVMVCFRSGFSIWLLVIGLAAIHAIAIYNGLSMFGKINPSHHLARLVVSIVLLVLADLGLN